MKLDNSIFRVLLTRTYVTKPNPLIPIDHRSRTIDVTGYDDPIISITEKAIDFWHWSDDYIYRAVFMRDYYGKEIFLGSHRLERAKEVKEVAAS